MTYQAPVNDIMLALKTAGDFDGLCARGIYDGLDQETVRAIVEEAGRFGTEVLAPINQSGDQAGCRLVDGRVEVPDGFAEAYRAYAAGGWTAQSGSERWGGQALPVLVSMATCEIWNAANLAFGLCPMLSQAAVDALAAHGSPELQQTYIPKLVSGEWTGTMNLTEPHAGSDLGPLRTRAERQPDGTYRLFGTKIYITFGEHEMTENIIHMVLARLPDAPAGTRGISLFLVPKRLVNADGTLGAHNDVVCAGLEHKLGIHASPTCVMKYGENDGAVSYLVGEENRGLNVMFIMMNAARLGVGVQGVGMADRATQHAAAYAQERRQGRLPGATGGEMVPIIEHPDIKRTLICMRALTQASRMICMATAAAMDVAVRAGSDLDRAAAAGRAALLTPIAKAFPTDVAVDVASMGVQVHGGMGFIEETGAAQHLRDARILPIYEGTNGIQAIDLVTRKLPLDGGQVLASYIAELEQNIEGVRASNHPAFAHVADRLSAAVDDLKAASAWLGEALNSNPNAALAGATPYLRLFGLAAGGVYLARGALTAQRDGVGSWPTALARFFADNLSTESSRLAASIMSGADVVVAQTTDQLAG